MIRRLVAWIVIPAVVCAASVALAKDPEPAPTASAAQVEKLQQQLDQMSKELEEMRQLVKNSDLSSQQRQMMMGHMGRMEGRMHGMIGVLHDGPGELPGPHGCDAGAVTSADG